MTILNVLPICEKAAAPSTPTLLLRAHNASEGAPEERVPPKGWPATVLSLTTHE